MSIFKRLNLRIKVILFEIELIPYGRLRFKFNNLMKKNESFKLHFRWLIIEIKADHIYKWKYEILKEMSRKANDRKVITNY
jgi:hypothetical protein